MLRKEKRCLASTPVDSKMLEAGASGLSHGSRLTVAGKAMPMGLVPAQDKGQRVRTLRLPVAGWS